MMMTTTMKSSSHSVSESPVSTFSDSNHRSNRKFWGEESVKDAVYNVYLKKITYSTNASLCPVALFPDSGISSMSSSSLETDLVDSFQRVFRRRSSFDKGLRDLKRSPKRFNNRSASVSTLLTHQLHNQQPVHHKSSSDVLNGERIPLTPNHPANGIRIKNYQKLNNEVESLQSFRTTSSSPGAGGGYQAADNDQQTPETDSSSLQWETRQIKTLKAGTIGHIVKYMLFLTDRQLDLLSKHQQEKSAVTDHCHSIMIDEERNNVSHVVHVLFAAYRIFTSPLQLFHLIHETFAGSGRSRQGKVLKQFNFLLLYWLSNYPEDFLTDPSEQQPKILHPLVTNSPPHPQTPSQPQPSSSPSPSSLSLSGHTTGSSEDSDSKSQSNSSETLPVRSSDRIRRRAEAAGEANESKVIEVLLSVPDLGESIHRKALVLLQEYKPDFCSPDGSDHAVNNGSKSTTVSTCILDLDPRFIAQQLTAIDLESFLSLKPYFLLEGTKSNLKVQATIKNFNLLSRQVILTILKSNAPDVVTSHWIETALYLRRMKNFNSLKAVIAGLTNESIFRLKSLVWSKLGKTTIGNFKLLSSVVDDVNNQTVLRQTQLEMEGTAKVSIQDDFCFGTIPYLGTFFTDLTFIDTRFPSIVTSQSGERMINMEKCGKQFEVLTQVQLLQKNVRAALISYNQSQSMSINGFTPSSSSSSSASVFVPRVARLFRQWFAEESSSGLSDNDCYKLSLSLEPSVSRK